MTARIDLLNSETENLFNTLAAQMGIPLGQFWEEVQKHLVAHPTTELSKYLIELGNGLEESSKGGRFFDTRIRSAAIMLETLEGRALAFGEENSKLREQLLIEPSDQPYAIEPMPVAHHWKLTRRSQVLSETDVHTILVEKDHATSAEEVELLKKVIAENQLQMRNMQISMDAKDDRMKEMEDNENRFQDVQRERAKLQEELNITITKCEHQRQTIQALYSCNERLQDEDNRLLDNSSSKVDTIAATEVLALRKQVKKLRSAIKKLI